MEQRGTTVPATGTRAPRGGAAMNAERRTAPHGTGRGIGGGGGRACRVLTSGGGGGGAIEPPKTGGGGFGKRAQLTGTIIGHFFFEH